MKFDGTEMSMIPVCGLQCMDM